MSKLACRVVTVLRYIVLSVKGVTCLKACRNTSYSTSFQPNVFNSQDSVDNKMLFLSEWFSWHANHISITIDFDAKMMS